MTNSTTRLGLSFLGTAALLGALFLPSAASGTSQSPFMFHHWDMRLDGPVEHVTEGLWLTARSPSTPLAAEIQEWLSRGVMPQRWRGGKWAFDNGYNTAESLAAHWAEPFAAGWPGIVIDEITADNAFREVAGEALIKTRELAPDLYIAVYVVPEIYNASLIHGLQQAADSVLVEAYLNSARRAYSMIRTRADSIVQHDLMDKSIIILGLGRDWITTPNELRRQLHFLRYEYPTMKGVGFFGDLTDPMALWLEGELHRFYTAPVLHVAPTGNGGLLITNIGLTNSPATQIKLAAGPQNLDDTRTLSVPALAFNQTHETAAPNGFAWALPHFGASLSVIGPPLLWGSEPPYLRAGTETPWPASVFHSFQQINQQPADWTVHTNDLGNIESATMAIDPSEGRGIEFRATFQTGQVSRYGPIEITLEDSTGDSSASLRFTRSDGETNGYWEFRATNTEALPFTEGLGELGRNHDSVELRLFYRPSEYFRVGLYEPNTDQPRWDTGFIPMEGEARFNQLRFTVNARQSTADISWTGPNNLFLRSSPPSPNASTAVTLSNITYGVVEWTPELDAAFELFLDRPSGAGGWHPDHLTPEMVQPGGSILTPPMILDHGFRLRIETGAD